MKFDTESVAQFRAALDGYVAARCDELALTRASEELCQRARANRVRPEQLLFAVHAGLGKSPSHVAGESPSLRQFREDRFADGLFLLLKTCFGDDTPVRLVHDAHGEEWTVIPIREGWGWDPEVEERRRDWLCCINNLDRRYISPIPEGWEAWPDDELAATIRKAPPDLRG
jgi:hypothetical protein